MGRLIATALLLSVIGGAALAQARPGRAPGGCRVGAFLFPCPKGYEIKSAVGSEQQPYIAYEPKHKFTVFAFTPKVLLPDEEVIKEALSRSFRFVFDVNYSDLECKKSDDFWDDNERWSRFEVSKFAKAAFIGDKNLGLHYQYILLKIRGKQVVAGYVYNAAPPHPAESWYQTWAGGGFGDASEGLQNLILAITKEKPPVVTPGGPPPAATSKTP
jgi:hypothetical protein